MICQTLKTVFDKSSKHLEVCQKYSKTVDLMVLMWTLAHQFSTFFWQKMALSFNFVILNMERVHFRCPVQQMDYIHVARLEKGLCDADAFFMSLLPKLRI